MGRNKETMKRVLKFISPYKSKIIIMLLTALVTVGFTLYTPILIGNGVDNIVGPGNVNTAGLLKVLGALAVIVVGNAVSQWVMNLLTNQVPTAWCRMCEARRLPIFRRCRYLI